MTANPLYDPAKRVLAVGIPTGRNANAGEGGKFRSPVVGKDPVAAPQPRTNGWQFCRPFTTPRRPCGCGRDDVPALDGVTANEFSHWRVHSRQMVHEMPKPLCPQKTRCPSRRWLVVGLSFRRVAQSP